MLNEKEVAGKLNALAAEFRTLMEHKEYAKAKNRYDTALNIAVALELPEHLSTAALLDVLGTLTTREELVEECNKIVANRE